MIWIPPFSYCLREPNTVRMDILRPPLGVLAAATTLSRAAARRILLTLSELGYVAASGRQFSLTPRILGLGYSYLASLPLTQVVVPHMERLVEQVHESCSV